MSPIGRVAKFDGAGQFTVEEEAVPTPDAGELVIDVGAALVSAGTHGGHIAQLRADPTPEQSLRTIGYQSAGKVLEVGPEVDRFSPGDRVAAMGAGYAIQADYNRVPVDLCTPLPDDVSYEEGAFVHLSSTALQGVRRFDPEPGAAIAVIGLGVVGQLTAQISRITGGTVVGSDLYQLRRDRALDRGIDAVCAPEEETLAAVADDETDGDGLDGGYMCFGGDGDEAMQDLLDAMKEAPDGETIGAVVLIGGVEVTVRGGARFGNVDIRCSSRTGPGYHDPEFERGRSYPDAYVRWTTTRNIAQVIDWMADGRLEPAPLITHRFDLDEINAAYDQVVDNPADTLGVVIESEISS